MGNTKLFSPNDDPRTSYRAWDTDAEAAGINLQEPGWLTRGREVLGFPRPVGPSKYASPRCASGKRNYCTCDTCW